MRTATGYWSRTEDQGGVINFGGYTLQTPQSSEESRTYSASANANWTLFDGLSNFAQLSRDQNNLEAANFNLERLKQDIVFQTISYYYAVVNNKQLLKVKEDDVKWNQRNLETINEKNKLGAVTMADVYSQKVKLGNAELGLVQAQNDFETSKSNLLYYLGLDVLKEYKFSDSLAVTDVDLISKKLDTDYNNLSSLVNEAMQNRYDYKGAKLNLESAYNDITIARSGHFPRITNNLSYNIRGQSLKTIDDSKTYQVGLTLSIPIFSGFSVENRVEQAQVAAKNQEVDINDMEREIKKDIQKTYLDIQAAQKALEVSKSNVAAAEENRKIEQEKYSLGSGTLLNVLIASSDYTTALTNYINSQFQYVQLSEQLKYYLGVLNYKQYE